jgi:hypothetical protein
MHIFVGEEILEKTKFGKLSRGTAPFLAAKVGVIPAAKFLCRS